MAGVTGMCPYCGAIVTVVNGLTATHDWPVTTRQVCPGSQQIYRSAEGDQRRLWNGQRNPHAVCPNAPHDRGLQYHLAKDVLVCPLCGHEQYEEMGG